MKIHRIHGKPHSGKSTRAANLRVKLQAQGESAAILELEGSKESDHVFQIRNTKSNHLIIVH